MYRPKAGYAGESSTALSNGSDSKSSSSEKLETTSNISSGFENQD